MNELIIGWPLFGFFLYAISEKYRSSTSKQFGRRFLTLIVFGTVWPFILTAGFYFAFVEIMVETGSDRRRASQWMASGIAAAVGVVLLLWLFGPKVFLIVIAIALVLLAAWSWADSLKEVG